MLNVMVMHRLLPLLMLLVVAVAGLTVLLAASPAVAADAAKAVSGKAASGKVSSKWLQIPKPAKGKGDKCVADTEYMRRNHMTLLTHQRDDTVHNGIRTKRFSLNECISCHAVTEKGAARPVTIRSPKHFCRTCHDYVAVRVDCFQCHASRPDAGSKPDKAAVIPGKAAAVVAGAGLPGSDPARSGTGHGLTRRADTAALAEYLRSAQQ